MVPTIGPVDLQRKKKVADNSPTLFFRIDLSLEFSRSSFYRKRALAHSGVASSWRVFKPFFASHSPAGTMMKTRAIATIDDNEVVRPPWIWPVQMVRCRVLTGTCSYKNLVVYASVHEQLSLSPKTLCASLTEVVSRYLSNYAQLYTLTGTLLAYTGRHM